MGCLKKCLEIVQKCVENKVKWSDDEFGSTKEEPFGLSSMYFYENTVIAGCPEVESVVWLRPEEIFKNNNIDEKDTDKQQYKACFYDSDGPSSNDVIQSSYLGNCWFVSGLSIVATHDYLIDSFYDSAKTLDNEQIEYMSQGIYPPMFRIFNEYGIYVLRFYKDQKWVYVIIDDRLPCLETGEILYAHTQPREGLPFPNEFWVSLVEKAYAKLHNCYQALFSGYIDESLQDLTGFASQKQDILEKNLLTNEQKDSLWLMLSNNIKSKSMMGCSADGSTGNPEFLNGEDTGLKQGHAYALLDVLEIKDDQSQNYHKSHRLLKMRNPWGFGEWKLDWSEDFEKSDKLQKHFPKIQQFYKDRKANSKQSQDANQEEEYQLNAADGVFFINFRDWRKVIDNLYTAIDFEDQWSGQIAFDEFKQGQAGGLPIQNTEEQKLLFAKNPQFLLNINRKNTNLSTNIFIQISQDDGRLIRGIKYPFKEIVHPIVCYVFELKDNEKQIDVFDKTRIKFTSGAIKTAKDISIPKFEAKNGRYVIIPATKEKDSFGEFDIRVYFDADKSEVKLSKINDNKIQFQPIQEEEEQNFQNHNDDYKKLFSFLAKSIKK